MRTPIIFCERSPDHRNLHPFPTRRSSDLQQADRFRLVRADDVLARRRPDAGHHRGALQDDDLELRRSEEHTSELQSPVHLVCRLLLEKKNNAPVGDTVGHRGGRSETRFRSGGRTRPSRGRTSECAPRSFSAKDPPTTETSTLSLHDALPISSKLIDFDWFEPTMFWLAGGLTLVTIAALYKMMTSSFGDRKSTRLNSSHPSISYAVFCLKKKITRPSEILLDIGVADRKHASALEDEHARLVGERRNAHPDHFLRKIPRPPKPPPFPYTTLFRSPAS